MDQMLCEKENEFYSDAAKYWEKIPPTVNGMLGGFGFISKTDVEGSSIFLKSLFKVSTVVIVILAINYKQFLLPKHSLINRPVV